MVTWHIYLKMQCIPRATSEQLLPAPTGLTIETTEVQAILKLQMSHLRYKIFDLLS